MQPTFMHRLPVLHRQTFKVPATCLAILLLFSAALLAGCSGVATSPDPTDRLVATGYVTYGWRSEPLTQGGNSKDRLTQADPAIRMAIAEKLGELGYREAPRDEAQFLIEYLAAGGINDGLLGRSGTNIGRATMGTINRLPDGATVDNAYALSGVVETGNLVIVFVDRAQTEILWRVAISSVIEDTNRVDPASVRNAVRKGLSTLPRASSL